MTANRPSNETDLAATLEWYAASGVDLAVDEAPVDQFALQASRPSVKKPAAPAPPPPGVAEATPPPPAAAKPPEAADSQEATALAQSAKSLDELRDILEKFEGSPLKLRATQLVFSDGNPEADIMLLGEAPGRDEDLQGKPFVGRSGQLLDRMLGAIGLDRTKVYIANTVTWRPPGNRNPTPMEIAISLPFLHRQIALVAPKYIMTLGAPAASTLFGEPVAITKARGRWREVEIEGQIIKALPSFHPAFLLRQPAQKQLAWRDLLTLKKALEGDGEQA